MKKHQKFMSFAFMAFFAMASLCSAKAETLPEYDFKLNIESERQETPITAEASAERNFELVLGMVSDVASVSENNPEFDSVLYLPKNSVLAGYSPVITINNSYSNEISQDGSQKSNSFTLSDGSGKWQFTGALERKYFKQVDSERTAGASNANLRGSAVADNSVGEAQSATLENSDFKTSLASNYRLEVVYSFNPTVKGKVSFAQAAIDDYDAGKTIQAEAIVEPRSNMQIKAGVKNQFESDAISNDTNSGKENKVWTEFILKF